MGQVIIDGLQPEKGGEPKVDFLELQYDKDLISQTRNEKDGIFSTRQLLLPRLQLPERDGAGAGAGVGLKERF